STSTSRSGNGKRGRKIFAPKQGKKQGIFRFPAQDRRILPKFRNFASEAGNYQGIPGFQRQLIHTQWLTNEKAECRQLNRELTGNFPNVIQSQRRSPSPEARHRKWKLATRLPLLLAFARS